MKDLYVLFTMDCEAIAEMSSAGGPPDWEFCNKSIQGFCNLLFAENFKPTLFVVPGTAQKFGAVLSEIEKEGAELGMHVHPMDHGYKDYLGAYDAEQQCRIITHTADIWTDGMGKRPESFRSGNMSCNDYTYSVLESLGFRQGSLCVPEKNITKTKTNWKGAPLFPHHTNRANRLLEGDMDFLEVPVTVDWESFLMGGTAPLELRIEMADSSLHGYTIRKSIDRQLSEGRSYIVLVILTHNIFDYTNPSELRTQVLKGVIKEIKEYAANKELCVKGMTLRDFHTIL